MCLTPSQSTNGKPTSKPKREWDFKCGLSFTKAHIACKARRPEVTILMRGPDWQALFSIIVCRVPLNLSKTEPWQDKDKQACVTLKPVHFFLVSHCTSGNLVTFSPQSSDPPMLATCSWIKRLRHVFTRLWHMSSGPAGLEQDPWGFQDESWVLQKCPLVCIEELQSCQAAWLGWKTNNFVHFLKSGSPWDEWERQSDQSAQKGIAGRAKGIHCSHGAHCLVGQLTKVRRCHHSVVTWVSGELQTTVPRVHERKINVKANYLLYSDNEEQEKQSEFPFWNQLFPGRRLPSIRWSAKIGRLVSGRISSQSQISEKIMMKYY